MISLLLCRGEAVLREHTAKDGLTVGRSRHCDVVVQDGSVPSKAWIIEAEGEGFVARDAAFPKRTRPLRAGDVLPVGAYRLRAIEGSERGEATDAVPRARESSEGFVLVIEAARRLGGRRLLVGAQGEGVLLLAGDVVGASDVL